MAERVVSTFLEQKLLRLYFSHNKHKPHISTFTQKQTKCCMYKSQENRDIMTYSGLKLIDSHHISSFMSSSLKDDRSKSNTKGDGQVGSSLISWRLDKNGWFNASSTLPITNHLSITRHVNRKNVSNNRKRRTTYTFSWIKNEHFLC